MDKCPKCGDALDGRDEQGTWFRFVCGTVTWFDELYLQMVTEEGDACLKLQLAQRDEQIKASEAAILELMTERREIWRLLDELQTHPTIKALCALEQANSEVQR